MRTEYDARWVTARTAAGPIRAVTFVVDRVCNRNAGRLSIEQLVTTMATARGKLGSSFDYLAVLPVVCVEAPIVADHAPTASGSWCPG